MTLTVYRIGKQRHQKELFSGLGGLYARGRWTLRGRPVVYTSASISLAVLEYTLNYRRRGWVPASVLGRAFIPQSVAIDVVNVAELPRGWSDPNPPPKLQELGEAWLEKGLSAVLEVPSAIVVEESNFLLNPLHPDFRKITLGKSGRFEFDRRLARTRQGRGKS